MTHFCLICPRLPPTLCGVGDQTEQLALDLRRRGFKVSILTGSTQASSLSDPSIEVRNRVTRWGLAGAPAILKELKALDPDVVLVQWVPFLYARLGVSFGLPFVAARLSNACVTVITFVHEPWVPFDRWKFWITGPFQRLALGLLVASSQKVAVSIEAWTKMLKTFFSWTADKIDWVPIGAAFPVEKPGETSVRERAGISPDVKLVGLFHPTQMKCADLLNEAWKEMRAKDPSFQGVVLGRTREEMRELLPAIAADPKCHFTGYLPAAEASLWLSEIYVMLALFQDGISSRRSSAITCLAHGLPVISNRGFLTDRRLFENGPILFCELERQSVAKRVLSLLKDEAFRGQVSTASRKFFELYFSWDRLVPRLLEGIVDELAKPRSSEARRG